jgi:DNA topoisomerase-2
LKKLNFKAFPKVADAIKEGELAPIADNEDEAEEDAETGANAYDYLLGMPIWSLTQERIDKLNKQIGDNEAEMDTLIKLSKEDIWKRDLEDFITEWRFQLEDEAKRQKKVANLGRRASNKLKIGAAGPARKRKAGDDSDDSDFAGRIRAKKAAPAKKAPKEPSGLLAGLAPVAAANQPKQRGPKPGAKATSKAAEPSKPPKKESQDVWMDLATDAASDPPVAPIFQKAKAAAPTTKAAPLKAGAPPPKALSDDFDSADEEIPRPAAARGRRAATKATTYTLDDSDDSNGDDLLFDVGKMVKGIGSTSQDTTSNSRPLFSASLSRPGSSAGLHKKPSRPTTDFDEADDTDYAMLAPPPTDKKAVTARETVLSDDSADDDDPFVESPPKPKSKPTKTAPAVKLAAAAKKAPAPKKPAAKPVAEPKKLPLSPAAKAYAAKKAKQQRIVLDDEDGDDDEVEKVANELLDDDEDDEPVVARRPARKAAVAAGGKKGGWGAGSEDDDDDGGESESESASEEFDEEEESGFD